MGSIDLILIRVNFDKFACNSQNSVKLTFKVNFSFAFCPLSGRKDPLLTLTLLKGVSTVVSVSVRDNNVDQALKALKKKMQREGIFREMKLRRHYEKPSEKKARESSEAVRRARKMERKRRDRDGF